MKTGTEYRKRNHRITQDEDKQTEEIELRKLRKSLVNDVDQIMCKASKSEVNDSTNAEPL